jgi:membrane protease YdiL (CAAX protease family)
MDLPKTQTSTRSSTIIVVILTLLPLGVIGLQLVFELGETWGNFGYSLYKIFFLIPPLIYCRIEGIHVFRDIFILKNWRKYLSVAVGLGVLALLIFWGAYFSLRGLLKIDEDLIVRSTAAQFGVTKHNVLFVAPITIFLNSLLEEFFYRGFSFGLLVKQNRWLAYLLPAAVFTTQHMLFIYQWATPIKLIIAVVALFVFALVLQKTYEKSQSLVTPWVIHIFGDISMMGIAVWLMKFS